MLSHCRLGKHEVLLFGNVPLLLSSCRCYFHPPTHSAPHPQPVNLSGCDLKAVHVVVWSQRKKFSIQAGGGGVSSDELCTHGRWVRLAWLPELCRRLLMSYALLYPHVWRLLHDDPSLGWVCASRSMLLVTVSEWSTLSSWTKEQHPWVLASLCNHWFILCDCSIVLHSWATFFQPMTACTEQSWYLFCLQSSVAGNFSLE